MKAEKEPLTAEQLRAQLLHIVSGCESWTNTGAIASMLDTDTPRVRVLSMLQQLSIELLVDHKRDRASDMWMRMTDAERPVVAPGSARDPEEPHIAKYAPGDDAGREKALASLGETLTPRPLPAADRVLHALCAAGKSGATAGQLVVRVGTSQANVWNALSDLRKSGDAVTQKIGTGRDRHYAKGFEPEPDATASKQPPAAAPVQSAPQQAAQPAATVGTRFARWNTGELIIDRGDKQIELPRADVEAMLDFLGVAHARAIA